MSELLAVEGIDAWYGASHVLHRVSVKVNAGEAVLLLGRNGAGKTTLMRTVMGLVEAKGAHIRFRGRDVLGMAPHRIARLGIGLVPEDRRMFAQLTVRENLDVGRKAPPDGSGEKPPGVSHGRLWETARVFELFPALEALQDRKSGTLSGGQQQMLTIARTLMGNPVLLLLDEPAEGLAPILVQSLAQQLLRLRAEGLSMMISEQNLGFARALADRAYVMEGGSVRHQATLVGLDADPDAWTKYVAF